MAEERVNADLSLQQAHEAAERAATLDHGLPIGVLVTGQFGREDLLFSLAAQVERASPWIAKAPKMSAL
jgi:Asp-tRNA(Asn)/Glu-tRNA(Gln) amidotransferase A subunit family amidase